MDKIENNSFRVFFSIDRTSVYKTKKGIVLERIQEFGKEQIYDHAMETEKKKINCDDKKCVVKSFFEICHNGSCHVDPLDTEEFLEGSKGYKHYTDMINKYT